MGRWCRTRPRCGSSSSQRGLASAAVDLATLDDAVAEEPAERRARVMEEDKAFFAEEQGKLDAWADEAKAAGRLEIEAMGREIKQLKGEAQKVTSLDEKLRLQREAKALEKRRRERQMALYHEKVLIEEEQEALLDRVEAMLEMGSEWQIMIATEWAVI